MFNQEELFEVTEHYLSSLIAVVCGDLPREIDSSTPFGELGIDSFRVLKIVKALEADFGTLSKSLLFENYNVDSLARYFIDNHHDSLVLKLQREHNLAFLPPAHAEEPEPLQEVHAPSAGATEVTAQNPTDSPLFITEDSLTTQPGLANRLQQLFEQHKNEGCVSRGTREIAPYLFIGRDRNGYFNCACNDALLLIYAYTGPEDYFPTVARELYEYCVGHNLQLNMFMDREITEVAGVAFTTTPFGVLQRVTDLQQFSLQGSAMRRLRYQVSKFEKAGECRTQEYQCGTDKETDRQIAWVIDSWCAGKTMVNPLVQKVREEILTGTLQSQHRLFLTYLNHKLQNVILISAMSSSLNGYLMDLEFYGEEMPLGGLEFAIVNIIGILTAEGCDMFSLGGTYGCRIARSAHADPDIERLLDDLHAQNIFNDEGNLQFKNKFRPQNRTIYLCRPAASGNADNVIDIIMMIADPAKAEKQPLQSETEQLPTPTPTPTPAPVVASIIVEENNSRWADLVNAGFNPLNIPAAQVEYDLKTDAWSQLGETSFVKRQMAHLKSQLQQPVDDNETLKALFPFRHIVLTDAGRTADHFFCQAWPKKGVVIQNLLFPSCIYHQIDNGFTPHELPENTIFKVTVEANYKGNLDLDAVQQYLAERADEVAFVCIELSDNAAGGQPVSLQHLRQVRALLEPHGIALVIDATRSLENARYIIEHEDGYAGASLWDVARELYACADVLTGSLVKNFCVDKGGIIATNDEALLRRVQQAMRSEGGRLSVIEKKQLALALQDWQGIEARIVRRMCAVEVIWHALHAADVPLVHPAGMHCILIDIKRLPAFSALDTPLPSFLAWLYLATGIRAGAHSVGMQTGTAINELVRLAIPVGINDEQTKDIAARLVLAFSEQKSIPALILQSSVSGAMGTVQASYALLNASDAARAPAADVEIMQQAPLSSLPSVTQVKTAPVASRQDIAVVGMAGRYPQARTLNAFWENLQQGRDCVGLISSERLEKRGNNGFARAYRGGFLDDIDKFDSLFFNISPREAELLDPQERLFLEVAWEALEDAGYYPDMLSQAPQTRDVGVFVGAVWTLYQVVGAEAKLAGNPDNPNSFLWSVSNRVSHWMNFTGPSLTVDTACSSSLTALQLACEAILNGNCSSALVGGVNLDLHQYKFDVNAGGGALSPDGVCRSFGAGANGYVAGEGVGVVYLKPLAKAIEDRDNIYGVIKSAVVNHGGRTSGYTVPSPQAQGNLISAALKQANVDARTLGYIEAHGTGTELGDPIEIAGLTQAFKPYHVERQSCPVGSVKSNIGHLEAAAGIVSVSKVLLQMRHRLRVPSLHATELNEHIDFSTTPFYVQRRLEAWHEKEIDGISVPLRAGVSSFGAGGANAHVILEHFSEPVEQPDAVGESYIFPLSAKNEEQLRAMAQRLRDELASAASEQALCDIAFTLQHGRKSFDHRLAIFAENRDMLLSGLEAWLSGTAHPYVWAGQVKSTSGIARLLSKNEMGQMVSLLSQSREPRKIAQLWIEGFIPQLCSEQSRGRRISLPTYPFADKRHWIGTGSPRQALHPHAGGIHPLIDRNESTFQRQLFKKVFTGQEFVLSEHRLFGTPTLPGCAYLDVALRAGEIATGRKVSSVNNITWVRPLTVEDQMPLEMSLELRVSGDVIAFDAFSESATGEKTLYSQGKLAYATDSLAAPAPEYLDIEGIRDRMLQTVTRQQAYALFASAGLEYGPSFQLIKNLYYTADEALGMLELPEIRTADFHDFVLHPCLLDAAMQAGVVGRLQGALEQMKVPYSIGKVEVLHPLTRLCYSHVTQDKDARQADSGVSRENVTITDETGKVLVRITASVGVPLTRVHEKAASLPAGDAPSQPLPQSPAPGEFAPLYYVPQWQAQPLAALSQENASILLFDCDHVLYNAWREQGQDVTLVLPGEVFAESEGVYTLNPRKPGEYRQLLQALAALQWTAEKICHAWSDIDAPQTQAALHTSLDMSVYSFLYLSQAAIAQKGGGRPRLLYLSRSASAFPLPHHEAMSGFVKTLCLENPRMDGKVLLLQDVNQRAWPQIILAELHSAAQTQAVVSYENTMRRIKTLKQLSVGQPVLDLACDMPFRQRGRYLITGGLGGLGDIFARFLAQRCQATLILTGRKPLSAAGEQQLERMRASGADVLYLVADVARDEDVKRLLEQTRARFGNLDGVIHSAGVLQDSFLRKKTPQEMAAVLAPKVDGTFLLDEYTRDDNLDFFVTFSSLAATGGNIGQCDYAYANAYMDAFIAHRERLCDAGKRTGKSLSLNWSLWADGGMKLDEKTQTLFKNQLGIKPLGTEFGLSALINGLSFAHPQIAVLEAVQEKIERAWGIVPPASAKSDMVTGRQPPAAQGEGHLPAVVRTLSEFVMTLLKLSDGDFSPDSILTDLGFDSVGLTTLANTINDRYRTDINPILFFEHPSVSAIAGALVSGYREQIAAVHGADSAPVAPAANPVAEPVAKTQQYHEFMLATGDETARPREPHADDMPMAIVGIAGVMPQSENLAEFWDHLHNARNLVTEIPRDRWIWEDYDGNPTKEVNKSNSRWGGFMKAVDKFDPLFFGITPREAEMMDPQQRLFIEMVWQAIEDSGHRVSDLAGSKTGVFVGVSGKDYTDVLAEYQSTLDGFSASGNSHSILANRISFLFNLRGPSAPIDTACSSSLIALHRAVESIRSGDSEMAIVGGVQVMLTPVGHISLSSAGMLSVDGKCKTFDKDANGYVRGEGAGAIFIKPLARAEADGNPIYAVIKGSAENHGGRVTVLTAPNPNAQVELLVEAYQKAQIDPRTVGYIECHGTGTSLGDPIEIQALKTAFLRLEKQNGHTAARAPYCGLSSVKTNIGHLEPAAGIASLLKVLLAIKHRELPALLHFSEINPYIDLQNSPFYIVDKTRPWAAPVSAAGAALPRRAGISSFGWGGANAHVVLEEYSRPAALTAVPSGPALVILSAKNSARLHDYARRLLAHLQTNALELHELAYTLQVGRDVMEERLALSVDSGSELIERLNDYVANGENATHIYTGRVKSHRRNEQGLSAFGTVGGESWKSDIDACIATGDFGSLLREWVQGREIDWDSLAAIRAPAGKPRRISLPSYPFARDRHWAKDQREERITPVGIPAVLHPLLHRNTSTLNQQSYATTFSGKEFFLIEHQRTLPAAAYLEMARAAVMFSMPTEEEGSGLILRDIHWSVGETPQKNFFVELSEERNKNIEYCILGDEDGAQVIHCRGKATFGALPAPAALDIGQLKALMAYGPSAEHERDAAVLTPARGLLLQGITAINRGHQQLLVEVNLPDGVAQTCCDYILHPTLLDSAIQSAAALVAELEPMRTGWRPAALRSLSVLSPCPERAYVWARYVPDSTPDSQSLVFDIDITDSAGGICVKLKGLALRHDAVIQEPENVTADFSILLASLYQPTHQGEGEPPAKTIDNEFHTILDEII